VLCSGRLLAENDSSFFKPSVPLVRWDTS
jgi:hypothetical protein